MAEGSVGGSIPVVLDQEYRVKLGRTFTFPKENAFHTIKYDFKPKSVDVSQPGRMKVNGDEVSVSLPVSQAESSDDVYLFKGARRSCAKECVLIINTTTGEAILEKITNTVQLKGVRDPKKKKPPRSVSPLPSSKTTTPNSSTPPTTASRAPVAMETSATPKSNETSSTKEKSRVKRPRETADKKDNQRKSNKTKSSSAGGLAPKGLTQPSSSSHSLMLPESISPLRSNNPTPEPHPQPIKRQREVSSSDNSSSSSDSDSNTEFIDFTSSTYLAQPTMCSASMPQFTTHPPINVTAPTLRQEPVHLTYTNPTIINGTTGTTTTGTSDTDAGTISTIAAAIADTAVDTTTAVGTTTTGTTITTVDTTTTSATAIATINTTVSAATGTATGTTASSEVPVRYEIPRMTSSLSESACLRLCSEMHRLLMIHPEHSMTSIELHEEFNKNFDPADPQPSDVIYCIQAYNSQSKHKLKMVGCPGDDLVMISLLANDAMWKLMKDIQYLFIYKPTVDYTMSLKDIECLYNECYGRQLNPTIYAHDTVDKLIKKLSKLLRQYIQFDHVKGRVALTLRASCEVFAALACEILFREGPECSTVNKFMKQFHIYFGVPLTLEHLMMEDLESLTCAKEVSPFIKVVCEPEPHLELTSKGLFSEQLRYILTAHDGLTHVSLDLLPTLFLSQFHKPDNPDVFNWLRSPLKHASHVINMVAEDFIVWAPTGRPYPDTRAVPQSPYVPFHLVADIEELGSVPVEIASHYQPIDEPLPGAINIDFLDDEVIQMLLKDVDQNTSIVSETDQTNDDSLQNSFGFTTIDDDNNINELVDDGPTHDWLVGINPSTSNDGSSEPLAAHLPPSQGLQHGPFAGMTPQDVLEKMKRDVNAFADDDIQGRVNAMSSFIEYFGELSAREIERVEGPPKRRRRRKGKHGLAIHFPNQPSSDDQDHPSDI
jgi:ELL-associated factor